VLHPFHEQDSEERVVRVYHLFWCRENHGTTIQVRLILNLNLIYLIFSQYICVDYKSNQPSIDSISTVANKKLKGQAHFIGSSNTV
jgi:hypothetical protein